MVLFTTLALMILALIAIGVICVALGGAAFIAMFADVIVCVGFIVLIVRAFMKKKKG